MKKLMYDEKHLTLVHDLQTEVATLKADVATKATLIKRMEEVQRDYIKSWRVKYDTLSS